MIKLPIIIFHTMGILYLFVFLPKKDLHNHSATKPLYLRKTKLFGDTILP